MKKIFKLLVLLVSTSLLTVSCDYDESDYDSLFNEYDASADYYIQFTEPSKSLEAGEFESIQTDIQVKLLGPPQSQAIVVNLVADPSSTVTADMYELSSSTLTIPAGATVSNSVTVTTIPEEMPLDETLNLALTFDGNNATAGTTLNYNLLRKGFCALENGPSDLAGAYSVAENTSEWENSISVAFEEGMLVVSDLSKSIIQDGWGEPIVAGGTFVMEISDLGAVTIPRQYIYTTTWDGDEYRYEVEGSGTWTNCTATPTLTLEYDIYYEGDSAGLGATYFGVPNFGGTFSKN